MLDLPLRCPESGSLEVGRRNWGYSYGHFARQVDSSDMEFGHRVWEASCCSAHDERGSASVS